ncbi:MAG TPA: hypothetical protein PLU72_10365 [Candidatus Ozemobacteraceae bacterium]|nr:hypothetical protein [Candidatus Ozemobacteraceae bacterium]
MQSVQCPLCHNQMFSETFRPGERFPCPHCEHDLIVEPYEDNPTVRLPEEISLHMNWAKGIWKDGRLFMTPQKLAVLGEMVVNALQLDKWSSETPEQLAERQTKWRESEELLVKQGYRPDMIAFGRTLLDIFINLRSSETNPDR